MTDQTNVDLAALGRALFAAGKVLIEGARPSPPPQHPDSGRGDAVYKLTGAEKFIAELENYGNQRKTK